MKNPLIYYRYRIFEDAEHSTMDFEGVKLSKAMWHTSQHKHEKLQKWIRSFYNPSGVIEYEEFDVHTGNVTYKPPQEAPSEFYTRDQLFVMSRDELCRVANNHNIATINIKHENLVRLILKSQEKYKTEAPVQV